MVTIRPAEIADVPAVLGLWHLSGAEPTRTDDPDSLARLIEHDARAMWLAESDDRLVGTVIAGWDGWRGSVYRLVVAPDHRRRGLGRRLLAQAEHRLSEHGARRSQAIVVESDRRAASFWRTSGWEEQVERLRFVKG